jgi:hypothetical protein
MPVLMEPTHLFKILQIRLPNGDRGCHSSDNGVILIESWGNGGPAPEGPSWSFPGVSSRYMCGVAYSLCSFCFSYFHP